MKTLVVAVTAVVVIAKVALVAPAGTVICAGTLAAAELLLESVNKAPPAGAGPLSVTVPCDEAPPMTLVGLSVIDTNLGALTVKSDSFVNPLNEADMPIVLVVITDEVATVKAALLAPAGIVTLGGVVAMDGLLLASVTRVPSAGAGRVRVIVACEELPPITDVGVNANVKSAGGSFGAPEVNTAM
jgi:hypothetical protein